MLKNPIIRELECINKDKNGIVVREIDVQKNNMYLLYIPEISDRRRISEEIIKPLLTYSKKENLDPDSIIKTVLYLDNAYTDGDEKKIRDYIFQGKSILIIDNFKKYIVMETFKVGKRNVDTPLIETTIRAPKDAFTENFETNLSLIRYRIKDPDLCIEKKILGKKSKTKVALIYIRGITNPKYVKEINKRLNKISIDAIIESSYIQKMISESYNVFPQIGVAERSESASANILDGKVCLLVEGSNFALIMPKTFYQFLDSGDDHYENTYLSVFTKLLRIIALTISLTLSSLYVTVVGFQPDLLPSQYILALASSRVAVPVNAFFEAVLMEMISELLRESSIRLPKQIGPAIGIVGAIVIGQAAVAAGLVSPLMVIIVSLSSMSSFAIPDYTIVNAFRILKFLLLILTGIFGLFGFIMGYSIVIILLVSTESFGVPYMAPVTPLNLKDLKDYLLSNIDTNKDRPDFLSTTNKYRK